MFVGQRKLTWKRWQLSNIFAAAKADILVAILPYLQPHTRIKPRIKMSSA
jgi:hypothetical protein